jgi:hypothetical protein
MLERRFIRYNKQKIEKIYFGTSNFFDDLIKFFINIKFKLISDIYLRQINPSIIKILETNLNFIFIKN